MKILLLTIQRISAISTKGIYSDLMRKFRKEGHEVFIVSPMERCFKKKTEISGEEGVSILRIWTLNIRQTNPVEKGLSTLLIGWQFLRGIKKYFSNVQFDLVIYSTPPITFTGVIKYIKRRDNAKSYLLLKDIFPQNAVDIGMFKKYSLFHLYFRRKEKALYKVSDFIGCMSPANVEYLRINNPQIDPERIEVNPNCREKIEFLSDEKQKAVIRTRYNIPENATVFIYGGNLGKPQGIDFLIEVLDNHNENKDYFFIVAGSGTEYGKIRSWYENAKPDNTLLLPHLPTAEYDLLVQACDTGFIFLNRNFTIPNFPSRLLSYMECKLPVIAATDKCTDLGKIIEDNGFGLWSESGDILKISENIKKLSDDSQLRERMGRKGYDYMMAHYTPDNSYDIIMKHFS